MAEETYGAKLRAKGIGFLSRGRTASKVVEGYDSEGNRTKSVTDEIGNTVTEHNNSKDQVDVSIKAPYIHIGATEVRDV